MLFIRFWYEAFIDMVASAFFEIRSGWRRWVWFLSLFLYTLFSSGLCQCFWLFLLYFPFQRQDFHLRKHLKRNLVLFIKSLETIKATEDGLLSNILFKENFVYFHPLLFVQLPFTTDFIKRVSFSVNSDFPGQIKIIFYSIFEFYEYYCRNSCNY